MRRLSTFLLLLAACGGGGGAGGEPVALAVAFDLVPDAVTEVERISVRGTASAAESVRVNGILATSDDGFRTWEVFIDLTNGSNDLAAVVAASDGSSMRVIQRVHLQYEITGVQWIAWDATRQRVLGQSDMRRGLRATDGQRSFQIPDDSELQAAGGVVSADGRTAYVYSTREPEGVLAIDLATGVRTVISSSTRGTGPDFERAVNDGSTIGLDEADGRLLLNLNPTFNTTATMVVDLATGDRRLLPTAPGYVRGIAVDAEADLVYVGYDVNNQVEISSIDIDTGTIALVTGPGRGTGDALLDARHLVVDAPRGRLYSLLKWNGEIHEIDLATGNRLGAIETDIGDPESMVIDPVGGHFYVMDRPGGARLILRIPVAGGATDVFWSNGRGQGASMDNPRDAVFDPAHRCLVVANRSRADVRLQIIDPRTGDRSELLGLPFDEEYDSIARDGDKYFVLEDQRLSAIDAVTGAITPISFSDDGALGEGPELRRASDLTTDAANGRAWCLFQLYDEEADESSWHIVQFDLATGDRTQLPGEFVRPSELLYEPATGKLLVCEENESTIYRVDPVTGAREVVTRDLSRPDALAVHAGQIWAGSGLTVWKIDPVTGATTVVADDDVGNGTPINATAIAGDPTDPDSLFVIGGGGTVVRIDLKTGDRFLVSR